jgi:myosin V
MTFDSRWTLPPSAVVTHQDELPKIEKKHPRKDKFWRRASSGSIAGSDPKVDYVATESKLRVKAKPSPLLPLDTSHSTPTSVSKASVGSTKSVSNGTGNKVWIRIDKTNQKTHERSNRFESPTCSSLAGEATTGYSSSRNRRSSLSALPSSNVLQMPPSYPTTVSSNSGANQLSHLQHPLRLTTNLNIHLDVRSGPQSFPLFPSSYESASDIVPERDLVWLWRTGHVVESDHNGILVSLDDDLENFDENVSEYSCFRSNHTPSSSMKTMLLPSTAWQDSTILPANEFVDINKETGLVAVPDDLVTLTHLHEPAVVESLKLRYKQDLIYTSTGPVLLALNPFRNLRGLYGEATMKAYWEFAEQPMQNTGAIIERLPPHVYAIADGSFRAMMRKLEDLIGSQGIDYSSSSASITSDSVSTTSNIASLGSKGCNQSILVSGESGAGKTVTTKFVMKYLAALSQRSTALKCPAKRAYLQVAENKNASPKLSSVQHVFSHHFSSASLRRSGPSVVAHSEVDGTFSSSSITGLASVSMLSGSPSNTIEAQVLQSNPILESFGNARTVRNDNSSRFGKFIEIQFNGNGKLVGAQIETYLLEKIRLITQSNGERNYHIFFELLSGGIDARELSQYYLAPTARPSDFRVTANGTYDRRDGVTDRETFKQLRAALRTMQFDAGHQQEVLSVVAVILHASNLNFKDASRTDTEECVLDLDNIHLEPVCALLGISIEALQEALCHFTITAGSQSIRRSLNRIGAAKGLEAMLKLIYGALFEYLVQRINDSIMFKDSWTGLEEGSIDIAASQERRDNGVCHTFPVSDLSNFSASHETQQYSCNLSRPAASIGVLDIFGFESFTHNSFEQLCINFCNEALQQQFNAFVLKNEQAEYEREGIDWSFISFPENQDVLDLIEKRGVGILSILDDQCRAPGPSDKSFALSVYKQCVSSARFLATGKQMAVLQFSILHYAGAVVYSAQGFTEKNRDELPKETTDLLKQSENAFIRKLSCIIEANQVASFENGLGHSGNTPRKLHRADSAVGRATVGGQFRHQLRGLRSKIDATAPHYIRCLKPNDNRTPDAFDNAIVAEQLRCGGILESVRVARAGFSQHYQHADFVRRYRSLAWKELAKVDLESSVQASGGRWSTGGILSKKAQSKTKCNHFPSSQANSHKESKKIVSEDVQMLCKELLKILFKKLSSFETENRDFNSHSIDNVSPKAVRSKHIVFSNEVVPSWAKLSSGKLAQIAKSPTNNNSWNRRSVTSNDLGKVGIQMGNSKVFLRQTAFEALERFRCREQTRAATLVNSIVRMYLARLAYVPYRDAIRREMDIRRKTIDFSDEYKEMKTEDGFDYESNDEHHQIKFKSVLSFYRHVVYGTTTMLDKWTESKNRDAIHNPVPRNEWGKQGPSKDEIFLWMLADGIWVRKHLCR